MEGGWEYYNKEGMYGWEPPATVSCPPPPTKRRETTLFPQVIWNSRASASFAGGAEAVCFWSGGRELDSVAFGCSSLHSKPTGLLHGCQQLLVELLIGFIRWDVDPVKARERQRSKSQSGPRTSFKVKDMQLAVCGEVPR